MPLVSLSDILPDALRERRAVGAFNVSNYEMALSAVEAAAEEEQPVVLQVYMRLFSSDWASDLAGSLLRLAHRSRQPVVLHLDHGDNVGQIKEAIASGYTSVMYDGSGLSFDENARISHFTAEYAHKLGASAEGEIGHVSTGPGVPTEVDEAVRFVELTGVDALSVSIGTSHGYYHGEPELDLKRCAAISEALPGLPLVLHGGTGTPAAAIREAVARGVAKVNIATGLHDVFLKKVAEQLAEAGSAARPVDEFMKPVICECTGYVRNWIRCLAGNE